MRSRTVGYTVAIQDSSDEDGSPESLVGPFADGASELQSDSENFFTDVASDVEGGADFLPNLCADRARMLADRAETLRGEDEFLKELLELWTYCWSFALRQNMSPHDKADLWRALGKACADIRM